MTESFLCFHFSSFSSVLYTQNFVDVGVDGSYSRRFGLAGFSLVLCALPCADVL